MRTTRIILTFLSLTLAFVLFQNFGLIVNAEMQKQMSRGYNPKVRIYDPNKTVRHVEEFYNKNVAFVEAENAEDPKYFDHKRFLQNKLKQTPIYGRLKNWVEVSDSTLESQDGASRAPASESATQAEDIKLKVDPLKNRAMVRYIGSFNADLAYVQNDSNVQVKVYKNLDPNSQIQLEHNAVDEKTWIQYKFSW